MQKFFFHNSFDNSKLPLRYPLSLAYWKEMGTLLYLASFLNLYPLLAGIKNKNKNISWHLVVMIEYRLRGKFRGLISLHTVKLPIDVAKSHVMPHFTQ
jgi:hypothetical protein